MINGKSYIGKTVKNKFNERYPGGRWWEPPSNNYLINAAKKYGTENFKIEIIEENIINEEILNKQEIYYAYYYNSYRPYGYNLQACGTDKELKLIMAHVKLGRNYNKKENFTSKYKGVFWKKSANRWICQFNNLLLKKEKVADTEIEAAEMYDKVSLHLYGKDCFINFEEKRQEYLNENLKYYYENVILKNKKVKNTHQIKDHSHILKMITPLIWKMSIPNISKKINVRIKIIRYCIKKYNLETPPKHFWQKKENRDEK
jgi:hypothetical protein